MKLPTCSVLKYWTDPIPLSFVLRKDEMEEFLNNIRDINMDALTGKGAGMAKSFLEMSSSRDSLPLS
jgi:hypothetical protein